MCLSVMAEPFMVSEPQCLLSTAKLLEAMIIKCWPRFRPPGRTNEALRIIANCWLSLETSGKRQSSPTTALVSDKLSRLIQLLCVVSRDAGVDTEVMAGRVVTVEPMLRPLFLGRAELAQGG